MVRAQIVAAATAGRSAREVVDTLGCVRSHVYRTLGRFCEGGWAALLDRRRNNGVPKVNEIFCETIRELVVETPREHGYMRPTWTRELLAIVAGAQTGINVSVCVIGRILRRNGSRRGKPKPAVTCPLSERQQRRRLQKIRELIECLPDNEVAVYEDEVDIHLNPKIGLDWMNPGHQKIVMTPGNNKKAYIAGSLDARDGTVRWVGDVAKNSSLFVTMLAALDRHYSTAKTIHVVLDNYSIHYSHETRSALKRFPRIKLHFLPPYSPDYNRIERLWQELHANVTRNHKHSNLFDLCQDVKTYLNAISPWVRASRPLHLKIAPA